MKKINNTLSIVASIFLLASIFSVFEILRYYRITDKLQHIYYINLKYDVGGVSKGILYYLVMNNCIEFGMFILFSFISVYLYIGLPIETQATLDDDLLYLHG